MAEGTNTSKEQEYLLNGVGVDLFWTEYHYFIYRTFSENADEINKSKDNNLLLHTNYLQSSSRDLCILYLSRMFDRPFKKHDTNSFFKVLKKCREMNSAYFPIHLEYYAEIQEIALISNCQITKDHLETKERFLDYLDEVLSCEKTASSVGNLKYVRDKTIAHNDNDLEFNHLSQFWEEVAYLLDLSSLLQFIIGNIFFDMSTNSLTAIRNEKINFEVVFQAHWVCDFIENLTGKESYKEWWVFD